MSKNNKVNLKTYTKDEDKRLEEKELQTSVRYSVCYETNPIDCRQPLEEQEAAGAADVPVKS